MKKLTWEEYYENFYEWDEDEDEQIANIEYLESVDDEIEAAEVILALPLNFEATSKLLDMAIANCLEFDVGTMLEFMHVCNWDIIYEALLALAETFDQDDIETLYGEIDDDVLIDICEEGDLELPNALLEDDDDDDEDEEE